MKILKLRLVFTKAVYSTHYFPSLCLKPCHRSSSSGVPWEDRYADDLVIITELLEECVRSLLSWKEAMKEKRPRVNAGKTKIMIWIWTSFRVQASSNAALGAQEMQWAQALDRGP